MINKNINASVIFHAIKLSETWKKNVEAITKRHGITVQQCFILLLLANDPNILYLQENPQKKPLMAKELAEALNVSRVNISNLLNILLAKKLVSQITDMEDKRRKRLTLTTTGLRLVQRIETIRNEYNDKMMSGFSKKEKEQFVIFARTCIKAMHS